MYMNCMKLIIQLYIYKYKWNMISINDLYINIHENKHNIIIYLPTYTL